MNMASQKCIHKTLRKHASEEIKTKNRQINKKYTYRTNHLNGYNTKNQ